MRHGLLIRLPAVMSTYIAGQKKHGPEPQLRCPAVPTAPSTELELRSRLATLRFAMSLGAWRCERRRSESHAQSRCRVLQVSPRRQLCDAQERQAVLASTKEYRRWRAQRWQIAGEPAACVL